MSSPVRLILALHNHQPVGNFDGVIEQAMQDSYKLFLDVLDRFPTLRISLHNSGSLMEWLLVHHPEYIERLARMVSEDRVEIIGGAWFEPILTMLPGHDRIGQITSYRHLLEQKLGASVRGLWMPERVWEPSLVADLADAGVEFTLLDDFHFKNAGLDESELSGYYITEDQGRLVRVFPIDEQLRYLIPFRDVPETINYLKHTHHHRPDAVLVFGDDGEKFGVWPETKRTVYDEGWLERFFEALTQAQNEGWLELTTFADVIDSRPPTGKVYLPGASYREMTEWALPVERQIEYDTLTQALQHDPRWPAIKRFIRGGLWRNFKVKYPETDEMYCRMMMISNRLHELEKASQNGKLLDAARLELYRGQCNCPYWHGAFGGVYLPHLRNAIYKSLIHADSLIEQSQRGSGSWAEAEDGDFNLDGRPEVKLANDQMVALFAPASGGLLYELDVRAIGLNLLATITRRPESYHRAVMGGASGSLASINTEVIFKQPDLDKKLVYDPYPRKSLVDHFFDNDLKFDDLVSGQAMERGDFAAGVFEAKVRHQDDSVAVVMTRKGNAWGHPLTVSKTITLEAGQPTLKIRYDLEGIAKGTTFHFAPEFNFAGLPSYAEERYFHDGQGNTLGDLGTKLDMQGDALTLVDGWQGIEVGIKLSKSGGLWAYPIETVSQSEGGFEAVHQSVAVHPHWLVTGDAKGMWSVEIELTLDTSVAESRKPTESVPTMA
jgi:alpha-amylase